MEEEHPLEYITLMNALKLQFFEDPENEGLIMAGIILCQMWILECDEKSCFLCVCYHGDIFTTLLIP